MNGSVHLSLFMSSSCTKASLMQIGRSKVFLRTGQLAILEGLRGRVLTDAVIRIQCGWRSYIARKNFIRTVQSIVLIQSAWRTFQAVLEANKRRQELSATLIQSYWRTYMAQRHYIELKRYVLRGYCSVGENPSVLTCSVYVLQG